MTKILAFVTGLPMVVYLVFGGVLLAGGWLAVHDYGQRRAGAERVLRVQAEAALDTATRKSDSTIAAAATALHAAVTARERALAQAARDRAVQVATDSVARLAAAERDAARRLLEDSLATVSQLRGQVTRLVVSGQTETAAHGVERTQLQRTIVDLRVALDTSHVALGKQTGAIAAAIGRAEAAEKLAKLAKARSKRALASLLARCGANAGYGSVLAGSRFYAGPALTAGCRVFPW